MNGLRPSQTPLSPSTPVRRFPLAPHQLVNELTPIRDLFVLAPLGVPQVDVAAWRLEIAGLVNKPRLLTFEELRALPKREVRAFHQCAGDPRRWDLPTRRISNVIWGGVVLSEVLESVDVRADATFLWSYGLDHGSYRGIPVDAYLKDMLLPAVSATGALLAYEVNGQPLPPEHGYPVRLVVPGFYGTNSVKWLYRLELAIGRAEGLFNTHLYNDPIPPTESNPQGGTRPVWEIAPESVIVAPQPNAHLSNEVVEIWGWAWARSGVAAVEVSHDGGETWRFADVSEPMQRSWQKFRLEWRPGDRRGRVALRSRATDRNGCSQPEMGARNAIYSVPVELQGRLE